MAEYIRCARRRTMHPHFDAPMRRALRVAVISGGQSAEREISLQSGESVSRALKSLGHTIREFDPAIVDIASCDWNPIDVAFIALHGKFGEDGQVQQILENALVPYTG